jgi:hypothetical protein
MQDLRLRLHRVCQLMTESKPCDDCCQDAGSMCHKCKSDLIAYETTVEHTTRSVRFSLSAPYMTGQVTALMPFGISLLA